MSIEARQAIEHHRLYPFHGCNRPVKDAMFACKTHWFQLEPWKRQEIAMAMSERRAGLIDDSELQRREQEFLGKRGRE